MTTISHALVLPDRDFNTWLAAAQAYLTAFPRVTVVRSPSGNDLNRYRDVTAVQTPGVWINNDARAHIRRAYPLVVRVDVIAAATPTALAALLGERVRRDDRYGVYLTDGHLTDRFTIGWHSDARPARIVSRFNADIPNVSVGGLPAGTRKNEGIDANAPENSVLRAPIAGTVIAPPPFPPALGYGNVVQISTIFDGKPYQVTITRLKRIDVRVGQTVGEGTPIGTAAGATSKVVVRDLSGINAVALDPTPLIYWATLRLQATGDGVRVRAQAGTQFPILGSLNRNDLAEPLESHGRTLEKVGVLNEWLKLRTPSGIEGFSAAWLLNAVSREPLGDLPGVNLDAKHPLGKPAPARVAPLGWVRMAYKAVPTQGFPTINDAHAFYDPILAGYAAAGVRVIVVLTHQTFGEGAGFNWQEMYSTDRGRWNDYIPLFVNAAKSVATRYAGRNIVAAYQIWNEQDTEPVNAVAAVPIQASDYGKLLGQTAAAIRSVDPAAKILSGGHTRGPVAGANYARATLSAISPVSARPDALAIHPYGRGAPGTNPRYAPFGLLDDEVNAYFPILNVPVWFTEWGVLNLPNDAPSAIAGYASGFLQHIQLNFGTKVEAALWYAWADTMDNGYGLVNAADQPKQPLYDQYMTT
jgi:murein DD-endopeptidase MepM/ murein hydrolase activator NlpD